MPDTNGTSLRAFDDGVAEAVARSVVTPEKVNIGAPGMIDGGMTSLFFMGGAQGFADALPPWGVSPTRRDSLLRWFIQSEPLAAGAFTTICGRNSAFAFKIECDSDDLLAEGERICESANWGSGWEGFASQLTWDLLTSDKGAFIELIGRQRPEDPVIGIQVLDPMRCWTTGDPEYPVMYMDRRSAKMHRLASYQVYHLRDMPQHSWENFELQFCAASRVIRRVQTSRNIGIYLEEKTGGRYVRGVHVLSGPNPQEVKDAMVLQQAQADGNLATKYLQPVVLVTIRPDVEPKLVTLDLASIPDGFDEEVFTKGYITILALALQTDYGELAPLPGGGLGTATQSETMDKKASQKGAAVWRKLIGGMMNRAVMPPGCTFVFDEQDLDEEEQTANVELVRASRLVALKGAGIIDAAAALQIMVEEHDIDESLANETVTRLEQAKVDQQAQDQANQAQQFEMMRARFGATGAKDLAGPSEERLAAEEELGRALKAPLAKVFRNLQAKLSELAGEEVVETKSNLIALPPPPRSFTVHKQVLRDANGRISGVVEQHTDSA